MSDEIHFEAVHCSLTIRRPAAGVIVATFCGSDVGELRDRPFQELEKDLAKGRPIELFIDGRDVPGASLEVSHDWAAWLQKHKAQLHRVSILCGSKYIQLTANFVRKFSGLEDRMRIYTDPQAFDEALARSVQPQ